ncbi:MAG: hypothetical protein ACRD3C_22415 [Vicinamibacterales bacterium]
MSVKKLAVMTVAAGTGLVLATYLAVVASPSAAAQVRPYTPPQAQKGGDWTERIGELLPPGVETRAEATERVAKYQPDPVKYPVPRTPWDGKPDFSGVFWPDATIAPPPVPLESLYRPEAREYREGGGAARGLIDWRGIDTPNYHCWPPSPVNGSMGGTVQLVSAPGYLLLLNEGSSNFRIIPIVGENGRQSSTARKPSFQGSSVGHWEGDTLVVEVTNFSGKPWLGPARPPNQLPQTSSDALRIVERWSRPDAQVFEYRLVVEDQKMLTAPWTGPTDRRGIMPYDTVLESLCFLDPELDARHREFAQQAAKKGAGAR